MGVDEAVFYDASRIAITPMGFCFPGLDAKGGDLPPRKECAQTWHGLVDAQMEQVELVLLVGQYSQKHYLGKKRGKTLTETVRNWREYVEQNDMPVCIPLPHPSWRNNAWIKKNPWFTQELLPELRLRVAGLLQ